MPVKVVTVGTDGAVSDVTESVECRSTDEQVIKVISCHCRWIDGQPFSWIWVGKLNEQKPVVVCAPQETGAEFCFCCYRSIALDSEKHLGKLYVY